MKLFIFTANGKVLDSELDHQLVLNNIIKRTPNKFTPYLFSPLQYNDLDKRVYCVQAMEENINTSALPDKSSHPIFDAFKAYQLNKKAQHTFFIRCNPAVKKTIINGLLGKTKPLVSIVGDEKIEQWFDKKLRSAGFTPISTKVLSQRKIYCSKGNTKINEAWLKVLVQIEDPQLVDKAIKEGVGKRKGYGFGLFIHQGTPMFDLLEKDTSKTNNLKIK